MPETGIAEIGWRRVPLREDEPSRWILPVTALLAAAPVVVATVRALLDGWLAVGDNAIVLIRSQDVLTRHHPLLGTWSSASVAIGEDVNHPGPLLFDWLAVPAKLGGSGGVAVGVALLSVASIAGIAWFGSRAGGVRLAAWCVAAASGLTWTMGSELLHDPWNPHVVLLPFLFLLVLVVGMARGDRLALPVAIAVASLVVQTHLTYAVVGPALCLVGLALLVGRHRRAVVPTVLVATGVGFACWLQPLLDQVRGEGNLTALVGGVGASSDSVGVRLGLRVVAEVLSTPPWWARPSFEEAFRVPPLQPTHVDGVPNVAGLPSGTLAVLSVVLAGVVVAAAWVVARRRRDADARTLLAVAVVAVVLVTLAVVTQPLSTVGITGHQLRYLWPTAILLTAALGMALAPRRWPLAVPVGVVAIAAAATIPAAEATVGPANDSDAFPVLRELSAQLADLDVREPLLYDTAGAVFAERWTPSVMVALDDHGIEFQVEEEFWVRQLGESRRHDGDARERVFLREGQDVAEVPAGARRVALVEGITAEEEVELRRLERELVDLEVELNGAGRAAHALEPLPYFRDADPDVTDILRSGWLSVFVQAGVVDVPEDRRQDVDRYAELWYRQNRLTIALFVAPIDGAPG